MAEHLPLVFGAAARSARSAAVLAPQPYCLLRATESVERGVPRKGFNSARRATVWCFGFKLPTPALSARADWWGTWRVTFWPATIHALEGCSDAERGCQRYDRTQRSSGKAQFTGPFPRRHSTATLGRRSRALRSATALRATII